MSFARILITGTDTDVGKTVFAAALTQALAAYYWKPVQSGLDAQGCGDAATVAWLAGIAPDRILPEAYRFATPCSPHRAAEIEGATIDPLQLALPDPAGPLVIEGAGGVLVPLTRTQTFAEVFARWGCPAVLVARTTLGTINHCLLSLETLRSRGIPVLGVAFVGEANRDSEDTVARLGRVRRLGRLPPLAPLNADTLAQAFAANFALADFTP